jgi:polar amino acid transport system substrate-binding protein
MSVFKRAGVNFEESYSKESLFKKLVLGRIDLSIEIELSGLSIINRLFPDQSSKFIFIGIQRSITPVAIMIESNHPNGRQLGERLKAGLQTLINNGRYLDILEKYYGRGKVPADWLERLSKYSRTYDLSMLDRLSPARHIYSAEHRR